MTTNHPIDVCTDEDTKPGNYFVSNYPPYSFWTPHRVSEAFQALERPPASGTPLGIYLHVPFCRKRCHFCYFRVYTDADAAQIEGYLDALIQELEIYCPEAVYRWAQAEVCLLRRRHADLSSRLAIQVL